MINRGFRTTLLSSCLIILLEGCTTTNTGSVTIKYHGEKVSTNSNYQAQYDWRTQLNSPAKGYEKLHKEFKETDERLKSLTREKLVPDF